MEFEKHVKLLVTQLKSKDINTIIKVIVILFILRECYFVFTNFTYYSNTFELWSVLSILSKYSFIYPFIFILGLAFLWKHQKVGWIITSGIFLFYLYDALSYALFSFNLITQGSDNTNYDSLYQKYGNMTAFLNELIMVIIFIFMLIYLWSNSVKIYFKIKSIDFLPVFLICLFSLLMYYFGYQIEFLN